MGILEFLTTDMLSKNISTGLYLYLRDSIISVAILISTNLDPKIEASTVFWSLIYQMIGTLLT